MYKVNRHARLRAHSDELPAIVFRSAFGRSPLGIEQ
jgi:hypothetical protein